MTSDMGRNISARHSASQDTVPPLAIPDDTKGPIARFVHTDKIVGRLGEFPELTKAVREGDLALVSTLCTQLFELNCAARIRHSLNSVAA